MQRAHRTAPHRTDPNYPVEGMARMHADESREDAAPTTLRLWFAYPAELLSEEAREAWSAFLSQEDQAHVEAFRAEPLRREALASRALVRIALSQELPRQPESWTFSRNPWGKPAVANGGDLRFNLSNAARLVACLVARGLEVGVDLECHERANVIAALGSGVFSPRELRELEPLGAPAQADRALSLWTLKEAWSKAQGRGFSLSPPGISFLAAGPGAFRLELEGEAENTAARAWRFCLLDHAGHRIALAVETAAELDIELWEAHPGTDDPVRLPRGEGALGERPPSQRAGQLCRVRWPGKDWRERQ